IVYIAEAPKSNRSYIAMHKADDAVARIKTENVPDALKDPNFKGDEKISGYLYPHDYKNGYVEQQYLPDELKNEVFYTPTDRGYEKTIQSLRKERKS
ncbi:MAG: replication-associated recombination protein A, partial [Christensenellales bacterium]